VVAKRELTSIDPGFRPQARGVVINMDAYRMQCAERAEERRRRRELDPCGLGIYGPSEDEGA
jgi:hypothetical protein